MMPGVERVNEKQQPGVVIYRPVDESGASHGRLTAAGCRLHIVDADEDLAMALREARPVHALLASSLKRQRLGRADLEALPELRIVSKYTIGVDDIDVEAASELGILVTHCPTEANWGGVAEGTIALMLALLKKLALRDCRVRQGAWRSEDLRGTYLGAREDGYSGITIGLVGLGRIGRRVAALLAPWKVRLLACDPYFDAGVFGQAGAERVTLDELLSEADVVSLHCALTPETAGLIGASELGRMKPGAVLINTARGTMIDVDAVCDALDSGRLGGAALDVLPEEPPSLDARILTTDERVMLSPHMIAANQGGTLLAAVPWATDAVLAALAGRVPEHVCNADAIERWRSRFPGSLLAEVRS